MFATTDMNREIKLFTLIMAGMFSMLMFIGSICIFGIVLLVYTWIMNVTVESMLTLKNIIGLLFVSIAISVVVFANYSKRLCRPEIYDPIYLDDSDEQ